MNPQEEALKRIMEAARHAPAGDESAPFGFSTRVAALAFRQPAPQFAFGRLAFRALAISGIVAAVAVAANFAAIKGAFDDESLAASTDDPVSEVVDLGS